jgi:hypothetical protein
VNVEGREVGAARQDVGRAVITTGTEEHVIETMLVHVARRGYGGTQAPSFLGAADGVACGAGFVCGQVDVRWQDVRSAVDHVHATALYAVLGLCSRSTQEKVRKAISVDIGAVTHRGA